MNADANTAHRTSLIVCTCGIEFRLIDRPIIENATIRIRALEPLIKEFHVAKKTAHFSSKRSENDDDDDDDALSSIPRKWMDARARRTKGLADACISQIFLTVERSRGPDPLFFSLFFLSWVAILARPAIFFLWLTKEPCGCTRSSRNFLAVRVCAQRMCLWTCISRLRARTSTCICATGRQYRVDEGLWMLFRDADISNWKL